MESSTAAILRLEVSVSAETTKTCAKCGLIFDAKPREIGRSTVRPEWCVMCVEFYGDGV